MSSGSKLLPSSFRSLGRRDAAGIEQRRHEIDMGGDLVDGAARPESDPGQRM